MSKILIVGAGGFMGSHFVEEAFRQGHEVWAGVRQTTSRQYLTDPRIHFVTFDFDAPGSLVDTIKEAMPDSKPWDSIIYNLGVTKCIQFKDFDKINYRYLRDFLKALKTAECRPQRFPT